MVHMGRCEDVYYHNHGTKDLKPHIQSILLVHKNTLDMGVEVLGAV